MNKTLAVLILGMLTGSLFMTACKKSDEKYDPGYTYFPLQVGDYKIYKVHQSSYYPGDSTIENFEIKEVTSEIFTINGEKRYRLERFKRLNESQPWPTAPDSVYSVAFSSAKVIRVENNARFIKIVFPVEDGQSWNGNAENSLGTDIYTLQEVGKPYTISSMHFPYTATVLQNEDSNLVDKDYRMEIYAKDVGLIYKLKEVYLYNQEYLGQGKIELGMKYYERLTSYGKQ